MIGDQTKGVQISRRRPIISHLFIIDDTLFVQENYNEVRTRHKELPLNFCKALGQVICYNKLAIMISKKYSKEDKEGLKLIFSFSNVDQISSKSTWGSTQWS